MRDTANFSVFGGVYPAEVHGQGPIQRTSNTYIAAPLAAVVFDALPINLNDAPLL